MRKDNLVLLDNCMLFLVILSGSRNFKCGVLLWNVSGPPVNNLTKLGKVSLLSKRAVVLEKY